jgi:hypothetical protein
VLGGATAANIDVHFRYALTPMECGTFAGRGDLLDPQWASHAFRAADKVIEYGTRTSDIGN